MANSKTEIKTYFGQCKCCLNYAYLKNMWEQHSTVEDSENREIYGKMLVDCFSISWTIHENIEDDKICEVCISRLKDAFSFKKQLLLSQDELMKDSKAKTDDGYKNEDSSDDEPKNYEDVEFLEEEILEGLNSQVESQDLDQSQLNAKEGKSSKDSGKKHRQNRMYTEDQLVEAVEKVQSNEMTLAAATATYKIPRKSIETKMMNGLGNDEEAKIQQNPVSKTPDYTKDYILKQHKDNIRYVLASSNATPFKGHWGIGYACYFCPQQFPKPSDLKSHTFEHANLMLNFKLKCLNEHIVNLDVTALKCKICDAAIASLDNLMVHMKMLHQMNIHLDIPSHIVPFSFNDDILECVKCAQQFSSFKYLSEHMNDVHYRNYECNECHRGFANMISLKTHSTRHRIGIFACSNCPKRFDTKTKAIEHERIEHQLHNLEHERIEHQLNNLEHERIEHQLNNLEHERIEHQLNNLEHERIEHQSNNLICKCNYCDEKFVDVVKRAKHEVEMHGVEQSEYKCGACTKVFDSRRALISHINGVHLLYKPHKCNICEGAFYLKHELKKHILKTHTERSYKCSECPKTYSTYNALKEHMHKHSDNRKHMCEVCRRRFQKEENYFAHMKNKHGLDC